MTITSHEKLLEVDGVTVRFGGLVALHDVGLSIRPGTVVGVIGPNGAGKTTLFNVVCGFLRPDEGELRWKGRPLRKHRPDQLAGLGIARTLQGLGLFGGLTVLENVMTGAGRLARTGALASLLGTGRAARDERELRARSEDVLAELDIAHVADLLPGALPYGVRKRVALARALVAEPELLLLDEPASGLSTAEMDELATRITSLSEKTAVVLVEHHMDLVMRVCDEVVVLDFGEVIATGPPDVVRVDPAVADAYLGTAPEEQPSA
ncbi:ABC transporter ATP-binding protein [Umezawaea tangerina]|uniref:Amino acid/amide ABC transporter ATP-binding protein 1 (HAAT family) n=1 Tax=Umezawaea tangerina TaxID=84725 RepID=A0A2T0T7U7_9PSEU|nr:ABC transporter ATP-binding protein [Umezawaea tangerina]PRY41746.1 amino acid/amide ABC transporter ATP-binding protein 1 (HAAT family) [Umezawaea tangerina]